MGSAGRRLRELDDRVLGSFERVAPSWLRALQGSPLAGLAGLGAAWVLGESFMLVLFATAGEPLTGHAVMLAIGAVLLAAAVVVGRRRSRREGS